MSSLQAIRFDAKRVELAILDQLSLPEKKRYIRLNTVQEACDAIKKLFIQGAQAIAATGVLSIIVEASNTSFSEEPELRGFVATMVRFVGKARPAVHVTRAGEWLVGLSNQLAEEETGLDVIKKRLREAGEQFLLEETEKCHQLGDVARAHLIPELNIRMGTNISVLTHGNTGSLSTCGYGTAHGVIRALHDQGKILQVYYTESRPHMAGSRLSSLEFKEDGLPATLIPDTAVAWLFQKNAIQMVIVGAARVALNGDVAGDIGTFQLAMLAKQFNVPFFVAATFDTCDKKTRNGVTMSLEERPKEEMALVKGVRTCPEGTKMWVPCLDVTPADLITAILTDRGCFTPQEIARAIKAATTQD